MMETATTFDPAPYLITLKDKPYLPTVRRIQWLRAEHPEAIITTQLLHFDWKAGWFVFHARVEIPGQGVAEGTGSETRDNFPEGPCEKAETIAIGRALAALGYGTAFALADFEEGRLADAPVSIPGANGATDLRPINGNGSLATPAQLKLIYLTATRDLGMTDDEVEDQCYRQHGRLPTHLTKREASAFIDALKAVSTATAKQRAV